MFVCMCVFTRCSHKRNLSPLMAIIQMLILFLSPMLRFSLMIGIVLSQTRNKVLYKPIIKKT